MSRTCLNPNGDTICRKGCMGGSACDYMTKPVSKSRSDDGMFGRQDFADWSAITLPAHIIVVDGTTIRAFSADQVAHAFIAGRVSATKEMLAAPVSEQGTRSPKTPAGHKARHVELHKALDELFADFIRHNPDLHDYTTQPIMVLLKWSNQQQHNPTEQQGERLEQ